MLGGLGGTELPLSSELTLTSTRPGYLQCKKARGKGINYSVGRDYNVAKKFSVLGDLGETQNYLFLQN